MLLAIVRMHLAHKTFLTFFPLTIKVTLCKLGRKVRLVARNEWLRLWPNAVVLPQDSHFAMIFYFLSFIMSALVTLVYSTSKNFTTSRTLLQEYLLIN